MWGRAFRGEWTEANSGEKSRPKASAHTPNYVDGTFLCDMVASVRLLPEQAGDRVKAKPVSHFFGGQSAFNQWGHSGVVAGAGARLEARTDGYYAMELRT